MDSQERMSHRVDVFVDDRGRFGNPLTIYPEALGVDDAEAQVLARQAGTSETVFVDDVASGSVRIFVPEGRVPFAGHPLVGVGWFLHRAGHRLDHLLTDAGPVPLTVRDDASSISVRAGTGVPWNLIRAVDESAVRAADSAGADRHDYVWAWLDEQAGHVRARAFTSASGTVEDEATGSAAVELCAHLGRALVIAQGAGSVIEAAPEGNRIRLSGRVAATGNDGP